MKKKLLFIVSLMLVMLSPSLLLADQVLIGLGATGMGNFEARGDVSANPPFGSLGLTQVDWEDYRNCGSAPTYPALGNFDEDPALEAVIGFGPESMGTIQVLDDNLSTVLATFQTNWPDYNNCGNAPTYPACGDVNGDGKDDIVIGLGETGEGRLIVLDNDLITFLKTIKVNWVDYRNCGNAPTYPACGNLDTDDADEIVIGLGATGLGRLKVVDDAQANYAVLKNLQVNWAAYRTCGNAPTYPACGDVDGDGQDEIVVGLGETGMGRLRVIDGTNGGYAALSSLNVGWAAYINCGNAPTYPACGNLDSDDADEIIVGLGETSMGRLPMLDDLAAGYANMGWLEVDWEDYRNCGSAPTYPACGTTTVEVTECNAVTFPGGDTPETHIVNLGQKSGTFNFDYQTYYQRDRMTVTYEGVVIFDTGCVGTYQTQAITYSGGSSTVTVDVYPNCAGGYGTAWWFTVHCPNEQQP
jgi:hypothetical protein